MLARRRFLRTGIATAASLLALPALARGVTQPDAPVSVAVTAIQAATDFPALEKASGGRLGVALLDLSGTHLCGHRLNERFPMCSTVKAPLAATVLHQAVADPVLLDRRLPVRETDLLDYAPVTGRHVGKDMTVRDLCRATVTTSDNTAANLLFAAVGGPAAVTAFLRDSGDATSRSDRVEPELNDYVDGELRDTTTPAAMAASLQRLVLGDALPPAARAQLADWLIDNQTGDTSLRAGLGKRWRVGDKTGAGGDARNDVAVLWPLAGGTPWVLTAYLLAPDLGFEERAQVLAQVGRIADRLIG